MTKSAKIFINVVLLSTTIAVQENKYKKGGDAEACRASSDPEGILSYVEDDDAAICDSARRAFAVIFLE